MADLYLKALESERKSLWAECRLKGLARNTPQRLRIAELDNLLAAHKAQKGDAKKPAPAKDGGKQGGAKKGGKPA